jgi:hypothetical protein
VTKDKYDIGKNYDIVSFLLGKNLIFKNHLVPSELTYCCGMSEWGRFLEENLAVLYHKVNESYKYFCDSRELKYNKISQQTIKRIYFDYLKDKFNSDVPSKGHITIATLINDQLWIAPCLRELGFRLVSSRTVNSNSGNRLYVYMYDPLTPRNKKSKKRFFR